MATVRPRSESTPLVIGLGNEHRGDDRLGLDVVRALRGRLAGSARLVEGPGDLTDLLALWSDEDRVIVVDAVRSGRPPGTVYRVEVADGALPSRLRTTSTHGFSLADAVALGRSLGRFPRSLTIFGIEAGTVTMTAGLSDPVARAVPEVAEAVASELRDARRRG